MSIPIRILLVLVAFVVVNATLYVALRVLGIEVGGWRYAVGIGIGIGIGIGVAIVSAVWRQTAPKDRPPPQSN